MKFACQPRHAGSSQPVLLDIEDPNSQLFVSNGKSTIMKGDISRLRCTAKVRYALHYLLRRRGKTLHRVNWNVATFSRRVSLSLLSSTFTVSRKMPR